MGRMALMNWVFYLLLISFSYPLLYAQTVEFPIATVPASWTNNNGSIIHEVKYRGRSMVRSILLRGSTGLGFACGFYCDRSCDSFLFAIIVVKTNGSVGIVPNWTMMDESEIVWSANRDTPVRENATLQLTRDGGLVLRDADGAKVWSTNTSGISAVGMNITESGNLVLFDENNAAVWQSFDHPTDSLLRGQKLGVGQRLTANVSPTNWSQGQFYLSATTNGVAAFIDGYDKPQMYYKGLPAIGPITRFLINSSSYPYLKVVNGSIELLADADVRRPSNKFSLRLLSTGELVGGIHEVEKVTWVTLIEMSPCNYPTVCGSYGICLEGEDTVECICPQYFNNTIFFKPLNLSNPNQGCYEVVPLSCGTPQHHSFLPLPGVSYFNYNDSNAAVLKETNEESCKNACLENCSCKAALFQYGGNRSNGSCFLPSQLFSLMNTSKTIYNSTAFIKVQLPLTAQSPSPSHGSPEGNPTRSRKKIGWPAILGSSLGALFGAFLIIIVCAVLWRRRNDTEKVEEDNFDQVVGMLIKFSYEDLRAATENFFRRLGGGGFGSVFEGTQGDGLKIAVKRLEGIGQGKKEFLAEVETIGSIHHVNLVKMIGFCAERSHRLLVYEYMSNGSLEKWIFHRNQNPALDWKTRKKIIVDIAKGLSYLHGECRQIIAHLDIKPQNILLDENFNAKVSDFGLSKLIDRDLSHVMTRMRGTRGYMAPEWLTTRITEKVDVYSFGVVVLEIVCGRKNLDSSQPEESLHLVALLRKKAEENELFDMVDKLSDDVQCHVEEAVEMIRIAIWCLQGDCNRRPSMSVVVKVLEGVMEMEPILDYDFVTPAPTDAPIQSTLVISPPLSASTLSGPR